MAKVMRIGRLGISLQDTYKQASDLVTMFKDGMGGFLFDGFSDLTQLYTTGAASNGSNASSDGQTIGFAFETSQWSNKTLDQIRALAPQLLPDTGFDDGAAWTLTQATVSGSVLTINSPTGSYAAGIDTVTGLTVNAFYELQATIDANTRGNGTLGFSGSFTAVTGTIVGLNTGYVPAIVTNPSWELKRNQTVDTLFTASSGSLKRIIGNHFNQGTAANRPAWRAGAKPYLQLDGTNDCLLNPGWKPGQACTVGIAFRHNAAVSGTAFGAGQASGNRRLRLSLSASGRPELAYNDQFLAPVVTNRQGQDVVLIVTYDASGYAFYIDGVLVASAALAPNMDGTGGSTCLGALDGGSSNFIQGNIYGAIALDKRVTEDQVLQITNQLRNRIP
jgi:hypothetical protein